MQWAAVPVKWTRFHTDVTYFPAFAFLLYFTRSTMHFYANSWVDAQEGKWFFSCRMATILARTQTTTVRMNFFYRTHNLHSLTASVNYSSDFDSTVGSCACLIYSFILNIILCACKYRLDWWMWVVILQIHVLSSLWFMDSKTIMG